MAATIHHMRRQIDHTSVLPLMPSPVPGLLLRWHRPSTAQSALMALVQAARFIARGAASSWVANQQATHQALAALQQTLPALQQLHLQAQPWQRQQQQRYASLGISLPSPLRLDEVMRVPLLEDKTTEEVEHIWLEVRAEGFHNPHGLGV